MPLHKQPVLTRSDKGKGLAPSNPTSIKVIQDKVKASYAQMAVKHGADNTIQEVRVYKKDRNVFLLERGPVEEGNA